jgi:hypothetical protein
VNRDGEGNYFNGIALNKQAGDGLDKEWGDVNENCLKTALNYISSGSYARMEARTQAEAKSLDPTVLIGNTDLGKLRFKGSVSTKHK